MSFKQFELSVPKRGHILSPGNAGHKICVKRSDKLSQQPAGAINILHRDHFDRCVHVTERKFHESSWDPFSSGLHGERICAGMSGGYIQKPGNLKFFRQLLEFFMQEWVHVWPEAKPNTLPHLKLLPAVRAGSLGKSAIHCDGDLRA